MTQPQMQLLACPTCGSVRAPLKDVVVVQPKNGLVVANAAPQTTPCPVCSLKEGLANLEIEFAALNRDFCGHEDSSAERAHGELIG